MTTFPTIDGIDMPASQLKKLAIPQKVYTRPDDGTIVTYGPQEVSVEIPKYYQTISISPTTAYTGIKPSIQYQMKCAVASKTPTTLLVV